MTGNLTQTEPIALIVDSVPIFRYGIRQLLEDGPGPKRILEAEPNSDWTGLLAEHRIELLITKHSRRHPISNALLVKIGSEFPQTTVVVLAENLSDETVSEVFATGVQGLLGSDCDYCEFQEAMDKIHKGEKYFAHADNAPSANGSTSAESLITKREREILRLIFDEHTNPEIAEILNISRRTVDTHRKNLLRKLEVRNTAGLIRYALEHGLLKIAN